MILQPKTAFITIVANDNNGISSYNLKSSIIRRDGKSLSDEEKAKEIELVQLNYIVSADPNGSGDGS